MPSKRLIITVRQDFGVKDQLPVHHDGLVKMITMRGGIDTLPRHLAHQMSRVDSNCSWIRGLRPQFGMYKSRFWLKSSLYPAAEVCAEGVEDLDQLQIQPEHSHQAGWRTNLQSHITGLLDSELFAVTSNLRSLTYVLDLHIKHPSRIGPMQREYFEDTYAAVQHALVSYPIPPTTSAIPDISLTYRRQAFRIACLIYFNTAIRNWEPASELIKSLITKLIAALQSSDLSTSWQPDHAEALLWILYMGTYGCSNALNTERAWLTVELRRVVVIHLRLRTLNDVEQALRGFLYRDVTFCRPLQEIWHDIDEGRVGLEVG